ncbi:Lrp/AsnC family transcriptional regulator [Nocardia sp. alder85J]|uniref:Lrp/AsnC family transcriptional regulator n=1 Tax=Nocardia sp. alder85J TaxID=2862949 RepID=UPI001CD22FBB|nr:Lrp/AsnC family transcriptional regulator [Nocardia sp. alder85J]MCX4094104.1 Lrp/AsnC family transcriptional regulator [Nocardia sp. alder85J]
MDESGHLDEVEYALLNALQIAPRAPWKLVGEVIGVSPVTAARRWERLIAQGHAWVTAYCASPLMQSLPYALVTVTCTADSVLRVGRTLLDDPHAVTVSHTVGTSDLVLAVWVSDLNMLSHYLMARLGPVPGVITSRVSVVTEMFAEGSRWRLRSLDAAQRRALTAPPRRPPRPASIPGAGPALSPIDRALILALSHDGRASFDELAARTRTSTSTVRRRLNRHIDSGTLAFRCELSHMAAGRPVEATLWIEVPPQQLAGAARELNTIPQTRMCAAVIGGGNLVLTVWLGSVTELQPLEMQITVGIPGIRITERLLTLRHLKLMGRVLDDTGRAERAVPMDIWRDPGSLGVSEPAAVAGWGK